MLRPYARRGAPTSAPPPKANVSRWRLSRTREPGRGGRGLAGQPQLRVHVRKVALHGASAQEQPLRDLLVAQPGGHQVEHFSLTLAQLGEVGGHSARSLVVEQERTQL